MRRHYVPDLGDTALMSDTNSRHDDFVPLDELEERELRRSLLTKSRAGDAAAQAKLFALYGVRISPAAQAKQRLPDRTAGS